MLKLIKYKNKFWNSSNWKIIANLNSLDFILRTKRVVVPLLKKSSNKGKN